MLKKNISENNITDLKLFYDGMHNKTSKAFLNNEYVQIRISKNKVVNHNNEIKLLKNREDIIYIDEFIMIKKWITGAPLANNNLSSLVKLKNELTKLWNLKINGITYFKFDENEYYNHVYIVLSDGVLRLKNIIVVKNKKIHLIDFEWINYTSIYFDLAHLYLYCFFDIKDIIHVFKVDEKKLKKSILSTMNFNLKWEKENKKNY